MERHQTNTLEHGQTTADFLPLNGTDYIEFYCGNAKQSAFYYMHMFGFDLVAYSGPETGVAMEWPATSQRRACPMTR